MPSPDSYPQAVYIFARRVSVRLLIWSTLSMAAGALLWWRGGPFGRTFGIQAVVWGAIDGLIAAPGLLKGREIAAPDADHAAQEQVEAGRKARRLQRLLWINTLLDVGYVAGGAWLARTKGRNDAPWRGHGWGIIVQGAFLFLFDLYHALACRPLRAAPRNGRR